mmetsp:Transcript_23877/g.53883  ORF Transcript_23877/g.53883 Transcript_23877/m.53883 type:complete len:211 (+) Transcript_23877:1-633(+)
MTPSPMPVAHGGEAGLDDAIAESGGATPLMTWGELDGAPQVLDATPLVPSGWVTGGGGGAGEYASFRIAAPAGREALAHQVDRQIAKKKAREKAKREALVAQGTARPPAGRNSGTRADLVAPTPVLLGGGATPKRRIPAARTPARTVGEKAGGERAGVKTAGKPAKGGGSTPLEGLTPAARILAARIALQTADKSGFGNGASAALRQTYS